MSYDSHPSQSSRFLQWLPWLLLVAAVGFFLFRPQLQDDIAQPTRSVQAPEGTTAVQWESEADTPPLAQVDTSSRQALRPQFDGRTQFSHSRTIAPRRQLTREEVTNIELFRRYSPSVVFIKTAGKVFNNFTLDFDRVRFGSGSGIIWDSEGHVVTNFHVVLSSRGSRAAIAERVQVILSDQSSWPAKVIGVAPNKDLAVLKIEATSKTLRPLPIGTSYDLQVGQRVLAIGSPFGLDQTLTTGIISGLEREIKAVTGRKIDGVVQTDAAINPGNSGGPLLDSSGRLIGLNTAIFSPSGAYAGIGFAIPVDTVSRYVPELIENGRVVRPWLGVSLAPASLTQQHNIEGLLVINVSEGGTAAECGVQPTRYEGDQIVLGDIIVAIDDVQIRTSDDLLGYLDKHRVGDQAVITVLRDMATDNPREVRLKAVLKSRSIENE